MLGNFPSALVVRVTGLFGWLVRQEETNKELSYTVVSCGVVSTDIRNGNTLLHNILKSTFWPGKEYKPKTSLPHTSRALPHDRGRGPFSGLNIMTSIERVPALLEKEF